MREGRWTGRSESGLAEEEEGREEKISREIIEICPFPSHPLLTDSPLSWWDE